jgi:hypothetical protein
MIIYEKILACTLQNDATIFQNIPSICDLKGMTDILFYKQDSDALVAKFLDKRKELTYYYWG